MKTKSEQLGQSILVDRNFQLRFARLALYVGVATTFITAFVILYPLFNYRILTDFSFLPAPVMLVMFVVVFVNLLVLFLLSLFVSHRISGPMFSFLRSIRSIGRGDLAGKIKLRKDDEFKFLARNINEMTQNLKNKTLFDLSLIEELEQGIQAEVSQEDLLKVLQKLKNRLDSRL